MSNWNDRINKIKKECKISYPFKGEAMVGYFAGLDDMHTHIQSQLPIIIREIVQEAIKPMDYAENVLDKNAHHLEISLYNQRKDGYNQACSEILSNVEEMIK